MNEYVLIANLGKAHGVNGAVKLNFYLGAELDLSNLDSVTLQIDSEYITYPINEIKGPLDQPIVHFKNMNDIDDARFLKGRKVFIKKETLRKLKIQLPIETIGAKVYRKNNPEKQIGTVKDLVSGSDYMFLEIDTNDNETLTLPWIDKFVDTVDYDKQIVILHDES